MDCKTHNPKLTDWLDALSDLRINDLHLRNLNQAIGLLVCFLALSLSARAQAIVSPSEPLRLMPPKPLSQATSGTWNQLPSQGVVLDPGAQEIFDAADPASPFQSSSVAAPRLGSKIEGGRLEGGLPDVEPSFKRELRSALVSDANSASQDDLDLVETAQEAEQGGASRKAARQRAELHRRLVATFPRDFLLDSTDPGLFSMMNDAWIPSRGADGGGKESKESRTRIERVADAAWQELRPELLKKLQSCDALLRKNSVHSARDEIRNGLTLLARKLDQVSVPASSEIQQRKSAIRRSMPHESALQHALRELDECTYAPVDQIEQVLRVFSDLVPQATSNHPWAADLLYALGKTYERELEFSPKHHEVLRQQSLACYRVGLRMAPMRGYISNQLGFNYLQVGSLDEATTVLRQALEAGPTVYSWRNLAELYRRRGAVREALLADQQAEYLLKQAAENR